jgi:hypothetical protein
MARAIQAWAGAREDPTDVVVDVRALCGIMLVWTSLILVPLV